MYYLDSEGNIMNLKDVAFFKIVKDQLTVRDKRGSPEKVGLSQKAKKTYRYYVVADESCLDAFDSEGEARAFVVWLFEMLSANQSCQYKQFKRRGGIE